MAGWETGPDAALVVDGGAPGRGPRLLALPGRLGRAQHSGGRREPGAGHFPLALGIWGLRQAQVCPGQAQTLDMMLVSKLITIGTAHTLVVQLVRVVLEEKQKEWLLNVEYLAMIGAG